MRLEWIIFSASKLIAAPVRGSRIRSASFSIQDSTSYNIVAPSPRVQTPPGSYHLRSTPEVVHSNGTDIATWPQYYPRTPWNHFWNPRTLDPRQILGPVPSLWNQETPLQWRLLRTWKIKTVLTFTRKIQLPSSSKIQSNKINNFHTAKDNDTNSYGCSTEIIKTC